MTLEQTPSPPAPTSAGRPRRPCPPPRHDPRPALFKRGMLLSTGALAWAAGMVVIGSDPSGGTEEAVFLDRLGPVPDRPAGAADRALAEPGARRGRLARFFLRLEAGVLPPRHRLDLRRRHRRLDLDKTGWLLLDLCWPLSMLGMFLIGIRIAVAGRWRGLSRWWPMVAESWAIVSVPAYGAFGSTVAGYVGAAHLCVGYAVLGQIVARKER